MRTIKFKGKRVKDGQWIYGNLADYSSTILRDTINKKVIFSNIVSFATDNFGFVVNDCEVDPDTVGQFTGLKDKNGKEIYEGDIFGIPCKDVKNHFYRMVEYCCDGFYLVDNCKDVKYGDLLHREISLDGNYSGMAKELRYSGSDYCVVGNIHDNPELLNEK